ncbi:MAG TPA: DnaA/Hda family protein, partial [Sumerlaeia bacterium]|nr:DnaA/Hda family protein [Sumerlaeia bacterium]
NGDCAAALEWIEPVIERGGAGLPIALSLKSDICNAMGDIPQTVQTLMEIVDYHENEGQFEEALPFYQSIIDVDAGNLTVHHRWLAALMHLGNTEEALSRGQQILPLLSNLEILTETERAERALDILVILSGLGIQATQPALYLDFILARATVLTRLGRESEAREILLDAAERFADDGDLEKAIEIFNYLLEIDPHDLTAIERLADSRMNLGQEAQALEGYRSLANLYKEQGAPDAQLDVLLKIADVDSSDVEVLQQILDLHDQLGNVRDARELRERMIRLHLDQREHPQALAVCRSALERDPKDAAILEICVHIHQETNDAGQLRDDAFRLIDLYRERGAAEKAGELFALLESKFPNDPKVLAVRILASCEAGDFDSILPAVERMVEINDEADRDEDSLAVLRQALGRSDLSPDAARLFPLWVDLAVRTGTAEENWDITESLIGSLVLEKRTAELAEQLRKIVESVPDFDPAWERLVEILKSEGLSRMALEALRDWAQVCGNRGDAEAALRHYQEALQTEPDDVDLLSEILDFRLSAGIRENAADIGLLLAHLLEGMGLVCQAVAALDTALKLEPNRNDLRELALALEELIASPTYLCKRYHDTFASQTDQEQFEAAYATITEAIHRFPLDVDFRRSKIDLLKRLERREAAVAELGNLSAILAELGRPAEAQKAIDEILELDPANSEARSLEAEIQSIARPAQSAGSVSTVSLGDGKGAEEDSGRPFRQLSLMKEYSFDDFIVGARNNFAYATALAISKNPGGDYNPLFLHGDVGLGKTHLLHAIAHYILEHSKGTRILYTSSDDFTNALIEAIQNNTIKEFRALHKSPDVLLVDDVHFLAEKERAQEEFFQIFNSLYQANRQIVMTSDRPPKEIAHLERRLRSRFGAGIIVDIQSPDLETRVAILRREAGRAEVEIDDGILIRIAQRIESNVRELKGALTQIIAHVRIAQEEPTEELVEQVVSRVRGMG